MGRSKFWRGRLGRGRRAEVIYLVGPSFVALLLIVIFPLGYLVYSSLSSWFLGQPQGFIGLSNYTWVLSDSEFHQVLCNTLVFTFGSTLLGVAMGLGFALLLDNIGKFDRFLRVIVLIPYMVSWVAAGVTFKWMFNTETGVINSTLLWLHVIPQPVNWLGESATAALSNIIVMAWSSVPFVTLIILAGLKNVPREVYEVSAIDGANPLQRFFYIILPLLKPALFVCILIRTMFSFRNFDIPYSVTRGGPGISTKVLAILLREKLTTLEFGYNAALSIIMLALTLLISAVYIRLLGRETT